MPKFRSEKRPYGTGTIYERGGSTHYRFYPAPGAKQKERKLGPAGMSTKVAEAEARRVLAEYRAPEDAGTPTFEEVGAMQLRHLEFSLKRTPNYLENCESAKRIHLDPVFGTRPVNGIKVGDIRSFQEELLKTLAPSTVLGILSMASGTFRYAQTEEWRSDNPVLLIEKVKPDKDDEIHYLTIAECEAVIAAVTDDERGRVEAIMYRTAAMAGLRRSELLALRWRDVDFENDLLRVTKAYRDGFDVRTKGKKGRYVPLAPQLKVILEAFRKTTRYPNQADRVFGHPATNKAMDPSYTSKRFKKACVRAGVGQIEKREYRRKGRAYVEAFSAFRFHDLRHSFCTHAAMNPKVSLSDIQAWAGHASASTTEQYRQFQPAADEAKRLGEAFDTAGDAHPSFIPQSPQNSPKSPVRIGSPRT